MQADVIYDKVVLTLMTLQRISHRWRTTRHTQILSFFIYNSLQVSPNWAVSYGHILSSGVCEMWRKHVRILEKPFNK
jgi:hypothetical protein